jgi:hypothetical protein
MKTISTKSIEETYNYYLVLNIRSIPEPYKKIPSPTPDEFMVIKENPRLLRKNTKQQTIGHDMV